MDELTELESLAEKHRKSAEELSKESERMMNDHRALVKRVKTLSSRASNSARMRDECSREASDSEKEAESWRKRYSEREGKNALDLSNEKNQINMYSQSAKGMRIREKKAESDRIKYERMVSDYNEKASLLKKKAAEMKRESNREYELHLGCLRTISGLKKE